jgi:Peptidase family M49
VGLAAFAAVQVRAQAPAGGGNPVLGAPGTPGARVRPGGQAGQAPGQRPAQPAGRNSGGRPIHNESDRAARWKVVAVPYSRAGLTAAEQQMMAKLADALHLIDEVYLRQSDLGGYWMYHTTQSPELYRLFSINGSRWDLVDHNSPVLGEEPLVPGHELYPFGTTPASLAKYVAANPEQKDAIYNPWTVVRSAPLDLADSQSQPVASVAEKLYTYPYHEAYGEWVKPMAADLRAAAKLSPDAAFAKYLNLRADALLTDDYYASDVAWLDLKDPKIDLIFAPYETYLDGVLGVKTSYGASILVRDEAESKKLKVYQEHEAAMQQALPVDAANKPSKSGFATPMEVVDAPLRAGDLRYGYQAVADNLPNDPKIHAEKGSKKIFFKNFMDARVNHVILPVAEKMMTAEQAKAVSGEGYLTAVILHEISHGLGPAYVSGGRVSINEAIGPAFSGLEEAKADVTGIYLAKWLVDQKLLPASELNGIYASFVAGIFRTLRFGTGEAHGRAEMMEFNYLLEKGALAQGGDGKYAVDFAAMPDAIAGLDTKLLTIEAKGDRAGAEAWFAKYDVMPRELTSALEATAGIPVDVTPEFELAHGVRP